LGNQHRIPVLEDLGSGTFIDFSRYGMIKEPTVQESVAAGADVITFSGDKLLGGPQAGIIVGKKAYVDRIKQNPINRALRIDKMTLAALESTLRLYRDPEKAVARIPTLRMLTQPVDHIRKRSRRLKSLLDGIGSDRLSVLEMDLISRAGGGSLPLLELPSGGIGLQIEGVSANKVEQTLRANNPPIIGRIENDRYLMDMRTIQEEELEMIQTAIDSLIKGLDHDTKMH
jgi:L-seryl-tRNA(Ser) seleniumtransferase